jgi:tetratricopeptide (TPR) repeat protein
LLRESLNQPLILIFEDLHWIDSETQGFLDVLSESVASARLLLLTNYRPEYRHEWGQKTYYTQVHLVPFGKEEAEEFLDALLSDAIGVQQVTPLQPLKQLILEKTEGTPFFMEEVVQELREQGMFAVGATGRSLLPTALHIPPTVQGILAARIDRLTPDEKALLQQLAVMGREFPLSLVRQVVCQSEEELYRLLAALQHKEFLYEQPAFPESAYLFKHALTQDVTYGTVLQVQRQALHERTGQALETVYTATLHEHYSDLAHHYRRSTNTEKAITYLHLAGQQAVQRSAHTEAISELSAALDLLLTRPETRERAAQELTLRLALGPALGAAQGFTVPAVEQHYSRARALCEQLGDTPQRFPVLRGLWGFYAIRSETRTAQVLVEEYLQLAEQANEAGGLLQAHLAVGFTCLIRGDLVRARAALEHGIALYQPQHQALTPLYGGFNPKVWSLAVLAYVLWVLGYPEQARTRSDEALQLAQELAHPFTVAVVFYWVVCVPLERGEGRVAQERADALVALASEHGFPEYAVWGTVLRGGALITQAQWAEGVAQVQQSLEVYALELWRTVYLAWLARGYGEIGQGEDGLAAVAEALRLVEKNDERMYEAEVYRLKGELTLAQSGVRRPVSDVKISSESQETDSRPVTADPQGEAEACFLKAIDIARQQQAKSWELRATMSLARLWQSQGKGREAHQMISEIYNWFTEGFDTKDLQEAKALLEELY